jgi:hypothetical protein
VCFVLCVAVCVLMTRFYYHGTYMGLKIEPVRLTPEYFLLRSLLILAFSPTVLLIPIDPALKLPAKVSN